MEAQQQFSLPGHLATCQKKHWLELNERHQGVQLEGDNARARTKNREH